MTQSYYDHVKLLLDMYASTHIVLHTQLNVEEIG